MSIAHHAISYQTDVGNGVDGSPELAWSPYMHGVCAGGRVGGVYIISSSIYKCYKWYQCMLNVIIRCTALCMQFMSCKLNAVYMDRRGLL